MTQDMSFYKDATIINPITLSEKVLLDGVFTGSITLPVKNSDNNSNEQYIKQTVPFFLQNNFSFGLGNKWDTLIPESSGEFLSNIYNLLTMTNFVEGSQFQFISKSMQSLVWKGSQKPTFSVSTVFVSTRRSYNPVKIIDILASTCLPGTHEQAGNATKTLDDATGKADKALQSGRDTINRVTNTQFGSTLYNLASPIVSHLEHAGLVAPLQYRAIPKLETDTVETQGTVTLKVGKWFQASDLVVQDISGIEFSKETIAPPPDWLNDISQNNAYQLKSDGSSDWGFPLYAKCTINLVPVAPITYEDFKGYFIYLSRTGRSDAAFNLAGQQVSGTTIENSEA